VLEVRPARTLDQVFVDLGVAVDMRDLDVPAPEPTDDQLAQFIGQKKMNEREEAIAKMLGTKPTTPGHYRDYNYTGYAEAVSGLKLSNPYPTPLLRALAFHTEDRSRWPQIQQQARSEWKEKNIAAEVRKLHQRIDEQKSREPHSFITGESLAQSGPLSEAVGFPLFSAGALSLVAGIDAAVGAAGEVAFVCDQRDISGLWVHVRNGPSMPETPSQWQVMKQLLIDLTAVGQ
jgi:hypothetical protein